VGNERDPQLCAALDEPTAHRRVVEPAQRDLHRGDRGVFDRDVQLGAVDVADADSGDEPFVDQRRERT
jgi:hypothetical protein